MLSKNVQFVVDSEGNRTAVILSIEEYENLMEDIGMRQAYCERKDEPRRPFREFVEEMRATGEIDV